VNLVLFEPHEVGRRLPAGDRRALHVIRVLGRRPGESFDAGIVGGARGKATLIAADEQGLQLDLRLTEEPQALYPVTLAFGACRPVAAQRILREATTLGVEAIWVFGADKAEASYLEASLWSPARWREHLVQGAQQAFTTLLPEVRVFRSLDALLAAAAGRTLEALGLDNYEAAGPLREWTPRGQATLVAVGPERGWSARERGLLRSAGFALAGLGERVLSSQTACLAAITLVLARRGLM
jgi:RsmE family RNA methyltransferase